MSIVDDLIANAGLYVGIDTVQDSDRRGASRVVVTALPGGAGVSLDYEIFNPTMPDDVRGHAEHTIVGRADGGRNVMVIAHTHGDGVTILFESEPGVFDTSDVPLPYPMKVVLSVPEPGRMRHAWWYGMSGDPTERDVSELTRVG